MKIIKKYVYYYSKIFYLKIMSYKEYIIENIKKYIFFIETNLSIVNINENNKNLLKEFIESIKNIKENKFIYYNDKNEDIIINHLITIILYNNNNKPVGYTHIYIKNSEYWFSIYIDNEYQNKKIGKKLMKYLLNHNLCKNIKQIKLSVSINNTIAQNLYIKNGFIEYTRNNEKIIMVLNRI
jgi:ribosomal protein S18 acetylase RimI-like enzyme